MEDRNEAGLFQGVTDNYIKVGIADERDLSNQVLDLRVEELAGDELLFGSIADD
jgi:hypothetical protein